MEKRMQRALKPDAQAFDEVRITTVPRYKTSGLSGDEWRISAKVQFLRNGVVRYEDGGFRNVETAVHMLSGVWFRARDDGHGYFAGEEDFCDQEGCKEPAIITYRVRREYSRDDPHEWNREIAESDRLTVRRFCQRHAVRGDCAFDDADENYEKVEGPDPTPEPEDESPSMFGGVLEVEPDE